MSLLPTLADLPLAGAGAGRLAFRMGIHVQGVSELSEDPDTWPYMVHNVDLAAANEELDTMDSREEIFHSSKILVSAVSRTSVTVSGPPARVKALFIKSEFFCWSEFIALPVLRRPLPRTAYLRSTGYAEHRLCQRIECSQHNVFAGNATLLDSHRSTVFSPECSKVVRIYRLIYWDHDIRGVVDRVKCTVASEAVLYYFGNSTALEYLNTALQACHASKSRSTNSYYGSPK